MSSLIGYGLVLGGLGCGIFGAVVGLWGGLARREAALIWVQRAVYGFALCMIGSNLAMIAALLSHDFSVKYVAQVGSRSTPVLFTVVSLWSALEGSILFWGGILGVYLLAFALLHRRAPARSLQLAMGVMCAVAVFFAFLIAGPANPWAHIPNPLPDGPGPNPLLQNHPLMIVHPPMLYLGYVGMTVPFGIAAGALIAGEMGESWTAPLRKWTLAPWLFLTLGVILGSWWAYAVLGWGGYWAWDPVENASFLPWLTATAFMHSTMVLERRRMLKLWTLALALGSFVLTVIGTFMTRSGVFNSVHSFTQSDIGPTFLVFIGVTFLFSIVLLVARGHLLLAESQLDSIFSREGAILFLNLLLVALTFTVFTGTTFPLFVEALLNKRMSVGEPYFNRFAVPGGFLLLALLGACPLLPWGSADPRKVLRQVVAPGAAAVGTVALCAIAGLRGFWPLAIFGVAAFAGVVTLAELFLPARQRIAHHGEGALTALAQSVSRASRRFGGYVVHVGVIVIVVAIAASSAYKIHASGTVKAGQALEVGDYQVRFDGLSSGSEPHRSWTAANVTILGPGGESHSLAGKDGPRMNFYERSTDPVGSPAVKLELARDVYVSLLAFDPQANTASFNAWVFPLVGWIWYAIPILVLGSAIALWPQRRREVAAEAAAPPGAGAPPVSPGLSAGAP
ncbi:MAG: heme lyase CcmF/NrfE family subunit [Myxococcales bacterium]|nr:heme lyase CcmF/NrfE family subunit [Myxococcales bacterium]